MRSVSSVLQRGRRPLVAALAVVLVVLALFVAVAWRSHRASVIEAQDRTTRLALLLSEQAARTFEAVDFTLRGFEPLFATAETAKDLALIDALLRRRASELSFVQTIRILDPAGRVVRASDPAALGTTDPGCLEALAEPANGDLAIGCTAGDVGSKGWPAIAAARRLTDAAGRFRGVIVTDIDPGYFSRFFAHLDLGRGSVVTLSENHGHVLLASTRPPEQGAAPPEAATTLVPPTDRARLGELARRSDQQISAVHETEGYPLSIRVGVDRSEIDRRWWSLIGPSFALMLAADALLLILAAVLERNQAERTRARQRAAVAQKLEAMGQMTASVAHDFRNILAAFDGSLRLLRKRGPDAAVLEQADATLARGNAIVERLLAFSRRQDLRLEDHDVNALLSDLDATLGHVAGLDTRVGFDLGPALPPCRLDRVQFDAALMNLVVNARQAMPDGGRVTVSTRVAPGGAAVAVAVRDTGCGIDAATLRRVFEPFFTTKAQTGTGLGLAQVQAFVEEIGGRVTIDSVVGGGTTVTLLLPCAAIAAAAPVEPARTRDLV